MTGRIKVAVIGVGNCSSALVQGVEFYSESRNDLQHYNLGGYRLGDIEFVASFDIDRRKVGKDLGQAIFSEPNNFCKVCDVPKTNVTVQMGHILDGAEGIAKHMLQISDDNPVDVAKVLIDEDAEVVVSLLPVGADQASRFYTEMALKTGCAFINATPSFIVHDKAYIESFEKAGLPLIGDDVMSQIGGTIFHKNILEFLSRR
ncbi:MAG: inositol-3-phosphate synthase, partial [Candidatus Bathyarchaeota archaeon]